MSAGSRNSAIVIGGGFFGLRIALHLREALGFTSVTVLEREHEVMNRSSYVNQARVHYGYHYPRSILTAYRSRVNFPDFIREFGAAIVDDFEHHYAIARRMSKVNARQFEQFCVRIGAPIEAAAVDVVGLFDRNLIEAVFRVHEPAFDARALRDILLNRIESAGGISVATGTEAFSISRVDDTTLVRTRTETLGADLVVGSVYSRLNSLNRDSNLPQVGLQHELTELTLVELPTELKKFAFTVMDGPFFSIMPFPTRGLHSLSHVRFTPHHRWRDSPDEPASGDPHEIARALPRNSQFSSMLADVRRIMPSLGGIVQRDSLWEVKTVLTKSDVDDSRPILFRPDHGILGYCMIMGGKLDNVYDVLKELDTTYG